MMQTNRTITFTLDADQVKRYEAWYAKQKKVDHGAAGGGVQFIFEPTGLGPIVTVKYGRKTLDLSDVDKW